MLLIAASMNWKLSSEVAQDTSNDGYKHAYAAKACCDNRHLEKHTRTAIPQTQHDLLILFLEPQVTFCLSNQTPNWRTSPKLQSTSCKTAELLIGPRRSPWQLFNSRELLGAITQTVGKRNAINAGSNAHNRTKMIAHLLDLSRQGSLNATLLFVCTIDVFPTVNCEPPKTIPPSPPRLPTYKSQ